MHWDSHTPMSIFEDLNRQILLIDKVTTDTSLSTGTTSIGKSTRIFTSRRSRTQYLKCHWDSCNHQGTCPFADNFDFSCIITQHLLFFPFNWRGLRLYFFDRGRKCLSRSIIFIYLYTDSCNCLVVYLINHPTNNQMWIYTYIESIEWLISIIIRYYYYSSFIL